MKLSKSCKKSGSGSRVKAFVYDVREMSPRTRVGDQDLSRFCYIYLMVAVGGDYIPTELATNKIN